MYWYYWHCTQPLTLGAVVLLISLAVYTGQVGLDLRANTDPVANLDGLDIFADLDSSADNLVTNAERHRSLAPATCPAVSRELFGFGYHSATDQ